MSNLLEYIGWCCNSEFHIYDLFLRYSRLKEGCAYSISAVESGIERTVPAVGYIHIGGGTIRVFGVTPAVSHSWHFNLPTVRRRMPCSAYTWRPVGQSDVGHLPPMKDSWEVAVILWHKRYHLSSLRTFYSTEHDAMCKLWLGIRWLG